MPVINCPDCGREVSMAASACPHCGRPMVAAPAPPPPPPPSAKEETLWRGTPSWLLAFGKIMGLAILAVVLPLILYFAMDMLAAYASIAWLIVAAVLLWQLINVIIAIARIKTTLYTVSNQRVIIETGLASKSVDEIDLRYIDDTQFRQNFIERLLGIGNVTIVSSDKTTPRYVLRGVRDPRALRELIRANAYQVSQRQLFTRST
jgi:uncharacterized membrane protein YdbT with pleckstrin-like domain